MSTGTFTTELNVGDRCCFIHSDSAHYGQITRIVITAGDLQIPPVHVVYTVKESANGGTGRDVHSSKIAADKAGLLAKL